MIASVSTHGVAVALAVDPDGPLLGVLILGEPGAGKSSLALALIDTCPYRRTALIADDIVVLFKDASETAARPPAGIRGLIEVRGFGPAPVRSVGGAGIRFGVDLSALVERVSDPREFSPFGDRAASISVHPFRWSGAEFSAPGRIRMMARAILGGQNPQLAQDGSPAER